MKLLRITRNLVLSIFGTSLLLAPATMAVDYDFYSGNDVLFYDPTATGVCDTGGGDANLTGSDNAEKAWNYFTSQGLDAVHTAAILGNLQQESPGIDPRTIQGGKKSDNPSDAGGAGYGIAQWTPGKVLNDVLSALKITASAGTLEAQLPAVWGMINGNAPGWTDKSFFSDFKATSDLNTATDLFTTRIERAGAPASDKRHSYAAGFLKLYGSGSSPSSGSDQSSSSGGCGSDDLGYDGSKRPGQWTEADIYKGHVNYQQCDPEWGNKTYDSQGDTLCAHACGPFSMANIIQNFGYNVDPSKLALQAAKAGILTSSGSSPLPLAKYFAPKFNLRYDALPDGDVSALKSALKNGAQVILSGRGASPWMANVNHIISIWGYDSSTDMVNVSDPGNQSNQKAYPLSAVTAGAFAYGNRQMTNQAVAIYKK